MIEGSKGFSERSKRIPIEETEIFSLFEEVADWVWQQVEKWDWKAQKTVGIQLVRAIDSVNANLVEGDGRHTSADSLHFFTIGRASAREARLWLKRAIDRRLVEQLDGLAQIRKLESGAKQLNLLMTFRRSKRSEFAVRERVPDLGSADL